MAINPNTDFTSGQIFTAAQANRFPRGILGQETLNTVFNLTTTAGTFADEGLDCSVTYAANRYLKVSARLNLYTPGGLQSILVRFVRGSTTIGQWSYTSAILSATDALTLNPEIIVAGPGTGATETFKVQIAPASAGTQISSYGDATYSRQFWVEDMGPA